jgi:hypothetical protein
VESSWPDQLAVKWLAKGSCGSMGLSVVLGRRYCHHCGMLKKVRWAERSLCRFVVPLEANLCGAEVIAHARG